MNKKKLQAALDAFSKKPSLDNIEIVLTEMIACEEDAAQHSITFTDRRQAGVKAAVLKSFQSLTFG